MIETAESHYEEFNVNDLNSTKMSGSKKNEEETNKRFSEIFKLKNLKFKDSGVDLPNFLNEYEEEKKLEVNIVEIFIKKIFFLQFMV